MSVNDNNQQSGTVLNWNESVHICVRVCLLLSIVAIARCRRVFCECNDLIIIITSKWHGFLVRLKFPLEFDGSFFIIFPDREIDTTIFSYRRFNPASSDSMAIHNSFCCQICVGDSSRIPRTKALDHIANHPKMPQPHGYPYRSSAVNTHIQLYLNILFIALFNQRVVEEKQQQTPIHGGRMVHSIPCIIYGYVVLFISRYSSEVPPIDFTAYSFSCVYGYLCTVHWLLLRLLLRLIYEFIKISYNVSLCGRYTFNKLAKLHRKQCCNVGAILPMCTFALFLRHLLLPLEISFACCKHNSMPARVRDRER